MSSRPPDSQSVRHAVDIVKPGGDQGNLQNAGVVKANEASATCFRPHDAMVQAVLQRLELILERRVQEAVAQLVLDHTQSFATRLREEIPQVVRQCMLRAIKEESAQAQLPHDPA